MSQLSQLMNPIYAYRCGYAWLGSACLLLSVCLMPTARLRAAELQAGAAKVDITAPGTGTPDDRLYSRALVLSDGATSCVLISMDVVAIGEIGSIKNDFLANIRKVIGSEFGVRPEHVLVNASHCHGVPGPDVQQQTIDAVRRAFAKRVPVKVGTGVGHEDRIMENRRVKLKSGREADVRHAYSMPPDDQVIAVGPVDPQIGVLRINRMDGHTLAVVYNFACHPIQGVPSGGNTADVTGFASRTIEENLDGDSIALFFQGCGGDINPVMYKDVDGPRNAEPLGNMLGLSTLRAVRKIECRAEPTFKILTMTIGLPRADLHQRIIAQETYQKSLLESLQGTSLNLKTFIPLAVKYQLSPDFPGYYSHRYMHDEAIGRNDYQKLDAVNRANLAAYVRNIHTMEELTRVQTNLALLRKHQQQNLDAGSRTVNVDLAVLKIGDFLMLTFPGELTVQIGLNIKTASAHKPTFVAGYTGGYIYYCPTAEQLANVGGAQEDSDCILAPEWQAAFERTAVELLSSAQ